MSTISEDVYNEILESLFNQVIMIKKHEPDHKTLIRLSSDTDEGVIDPHRDDGGKITKFKDGQIVNDKFKVITNDGKDKEITNKNEIMYILAHLIEANLK